MATFVTHAVNSSSSPSTTLVTTRATTRYVLGPLTTIFTPDPACTSCELVLPFNPTINICWQYWTTGTLGFCSMGSGSCRPTPTIQLSSQPIDAFYSPGLVCPAGWTTIFSVTAGLKNLVTVGINTDTLLPDETAAWCCPNGYVFEASSTPQLFFGETLPALLCTSSSNVGQFTWMRSVCSATTITGVTNSKSLVSSSFSELEYVVPPIQINWRSADLTAMPSHPSATGGADLTAMPSHPSATGGASGNGVQQDSSPQQGSLSPGAIGGIAAGVFVVLCILMVLFIRAVRRRSKRQAASGVSANGEPGSHLQADVSHKPDAGIAVGGWQKSELESTPVTPRIELDGSNISPGPVEMDDGTPRLNQHHIAGTSWAPGTVSRISSTTMGTLGGGSEVSPRSEMAGDTMWPRSSAIAGSGADTRHISDTHNPSQSLGGSPNLQS